jgi:hypothetical protein
MASRPKEEPDVIRWNHRTAALAIGVALGLGLLVREARRAEAAGCGFTACGTNTAELRGTPIRGLNVRGVTNADGVRVVPGSVQMVAPSSGIACSHFQELGYSIDVAGGSLIARAPAPATTIVQGPCLLGATFDLEVPTVKGGKPVLAHVQLRIAQKSAVSTWFVDPAWASLVPTYELIDVARQVSICPTKASWMEDWQATDLGTDGQNPPGVPGLLWRTATDHAIVVQGETYAETASADPARSTAEWFNVACAGSAIAKLRLLGYDPMSGWSSRGERQATLKMLTAHYVPDSATAFTRTGTPLAWISARQVTAAPLYHGMPAAERIGPIEARWQDTGAQCLSHLRLWMDPSLHGAGETEAGDLQAIVDQGGPPACGPPATSGVYWTTYTVDHIAH